MFKKYLSLFLLFVLVMSSFILFRPQKVLGANDHIVISQIQTGVATNDEFIELFNPTESDIDLSGFKLTRRNSGGVTEVNLVLSMTGIIKSNGYFLVGPATGYTGSVPLDLNYSAISNVITNNYSIRLYSNSNVLLDKVGYGTSPDSETSSFATNPTIGQSIQRINNIDTDNNSADFVLLQTSNPRNSNTVTATPVATILPTSTPLPTVLPTSTTQPTATPAETFVPTTTPSPTSTPTQTPIETFSPTPTSTSSATSSPTSNPKPTKTSKPDRDHHDNDHEYDLPFGFKCGFQRQEFRFKKFQFSYYKFHFGRR